MSNIAIHSPQEVSALYGQLSEEDRFSLFSYLEFLIQRRKTMELEQAIDDARTGQNLHGDFDNAKDAVQSMLAVF